MKRPLYFAALCLLFPVLTFAQNKSLGVGTPTPNANAALHVESPTNNQGIIIPRLTTAQRSNFTSALTATDIGLIVFDTDLRALTIWNGSSWDIGMKTGEPITASNATATGHAGLFENSNAFNGASTINASTAGTGRALEITVSNPLNTADAININHSGSGNAISANAPIQATQFIGDGSLLTNLPAGGLTLPYSQNINSPGSLFSVANSGTGLASILEITNASNTNTALATATNGLGSAADFSINNAGNASPVINITTNGTGPAIAATGNITATSFTGDGSGLTNLPGLTLPYTQAVNENGIAFEVINTGNGRSAVFDIMNPANNSVTLMAKTNGGGSVADFSIKNATNNAPAVRIETNGTGPALAAIGSIVATSFAGDGSLLTNVAAAPGLNSVAGPQILDASITNDDISTTAAIEGIKIAPNFGSQDVSTTGQLSVTNGTSSSALYVESNSNVGAGADIRVTSTSSTQPALTVLHDGDGIVGQFVNSNSSSSNPALFVVNSGSGSAIRSVQNGSIGESLFLGISSAVNTNSAATVDHLGLGSGLNINLSNTSNTASGIEITKAGAGNAITANAPIQATLSGTLVTDAISGTNTSASGRSGYFVSSNSSNPNPALEVRHSGLGAAVSIDQDNNEAALSIVSGGLNISSVYIPTYPAGGVIGARVGAYLIQTGGSYSFGFTLNEGDIFFIKNLDTAAVTLGSETLASTEGATFIYINGALRKF
ncbi:MAG: hypothetical protein EBR30_19390 [Cytophagia bacterium]|nr:hypothetical protein [Cytophagia bacterium]